MKTIPPGLLKLISELTEMYGHRAIHAGDRSICEETQRPTIVLQVPIERLDKASKDTSGLITAIKREYDEHYCIVVLPDP